MRKHPARASAVSAARAGALSAAVAGVLSMSSHLGASEHIAAGAAVLATAVVGAIAGALAGGGAALVWGLSRPARGSLGISRRRSFTFYLLVTVGALTVSAGLAWLIHERWPDLGVTLVGWAWLLPMGALWGVAWRALARVQRPLSAFEVLGAAAALLLAGPLASLPLAAGVEGRGAVRVALVSLQFLTDFDRDGASAWFGGNDCAALDASMGPYAVEVPSNGLDDNCIGGDLLEAHGPRRSDPAYSALPAGFPERADIVLVTIDSLRADHLGFFGYAVPTSPRLDRLAERAVIFESAFAQGPGTFESLPSMLTSKYPHRVAYRESGTIPRPLAPENRLLAEVFREHGYRTEAVLACHVEPAAKWGLCDGFDECDTSILPAREPRSVTSDRVTRAALRVIERRDRSRPLFLWLHYFDPHSTYVPHRGFLEEHAADDMGRYDSEIAFTDHHVGDLLERILAGDRGSRTVIALTADHGEGFKADRGFYRHGYGLSRELVHVPLVIWAPGQRSGRRRTPVGNIDVMPTLLNFAGIEEPGLEGRSLVRAVLEGQEDSARRIFSEKDFPGQGAPLLRAVTTDTHRLIYNHATGGAVLYDRRRDPAEQSDLARTEPVIRNALVREIERWMQ